MKTSADYLGADLSQDQSLHLLPRIFILMAEVTTIYSVKVGSGNPINPKP